MSRDLVFSKNETCLVLDYYHDKDYEGHDGKEYDWLFDRLKKYDTLTELRLITDFINVLPANLLKFSKLKKLCVKGSRFWNLTMEQIPASVEILDLTQHSNLSPNCLIGMERLANLKELYINDVFGVLAFGVEETDGNPIPSLPKLEKIVFESGVYSWKKPEPGWENRVRELSLLKNLRIRDMSCSSWLEINL